MKNFILATSILISSNFAFASGNIYRSGNSHEVIGYIGMDEHTIYASANSWNVVGYIGMDGHTIYANANSWDVIGHISLLDGQTIYANANSNDVVGYISFAAALGLQDDDVNPACAIL